MRTVVTLAAALLLAACATPRPDRAEVERQVAETERAFARTMAERDHAAFTSFLSDEAVFFAGDTPLRGRQTVAAAWKRFFDKPAAPFSWRPQTVAALDSGTLALSTGPVFAPDGKCIGSFLSIWRRERDGWRIVFDKGGACPDKQ